MKFPPPITGYARAAAKFRSVIVGTAAVAAACLLVPVAGMTPSGVAGPAQTIPAPVATGETDLFLPLVKVGPTVTPAPTATPNPTATARPTNVPTPTNTPRPRPSTTPVIPTGDKTWPMLAANPERTSWTPEEVRGSLGVDWYLPIEAYIPYKIQPIAANGRIYVATARGLYSINATDGAVDWVFATEVPLGHSPTIATINGNSVAFVPSYDHKIHALSAITGQPVPGYTPYVAGGGFETNPLVVNNTVYAGNRDGYFYALDAVTGGLKWRFKTEDAITFSAAYKDGTLYFASNDAYAYALNAGDGSLVWKSAKLLGEGFHAYWPVVYTDPMTGKDYVIFTGGENYRFETLSVTTAESETVYDSVAGSSLIGPSSTSIDGPWVKGSVVIDAQVLTDYFEARPDRRTVFILERATGKEFTFDSDGDGKLEYAPFNWSGVTHSGPKYPPVINAVDQVYYQATGYISPGWVSRGGPVGWDFGTHNISRVDRDPNGFASDEPLAYSAGGKLLYYVLCCDRAAGAMDVTIPYDQPNRGWLLYEYNLANNIFIPGYQAMYDSGNEAEYANGNGWQLYSGKHQSKNGVYGKHGSTQSPPIPYLGRLYLLKGNSLIAFSPNASNVKSPYPLLEVGQLQNTVTTPSANDLRLRLQEEVQKMLAAGPLRPGYYDSGFSDVYGNGNYTDERTFGEVFDYFQNPGETVYTLLLAYPYLTPELQTQVKAYLQNNYGPGKKYDFTQIAHVGWGSGAAREHLVIPQEVVDQWGDPYSSPYDPSTTPICGWCGYWKTFPPFSFYAAWQYAKIVGNNDAAFAKTIFDRMSGKLDTPPSDTLLTRKPYWLNQYIAGYMGYLELQKLAGYAQNQNIQATYQRLLSLRVTGFSKDTPYQPLGQAGDGWEYGYQNTLAVARNFMYLTPELGAHLNQQIGAKVQEAVAEYEYIAPYWFVPKFDNTYGEGTLQPLYDTPAIFQAKAWALKQPYGELIKWLDAPGFYRGDLFYIQNLAAALGAPGQ